MKKLTSIFFLLVSWSAIGQFNSQFNSYMFNGLAINPAYTGTRECLSVIGLHTSQWIGFTGAPTTDYLALHSPINDKHAAGLTIFNDRLGVQNQTGIYPSYAYHLKLSETKKLSFGVNAGLSFFSVQNSEVATLVADNAFAENKKILNLPNIGAGLYYYTHQMYVGFSAPSLFSSELSNVIAQNAFSLNSKSMNIMITAGGLVQLGNNIVWKPSIFLKGISSRIVQMDINSNLYYKDKFNIGVSYRNKDAFVGLIGFRISQQFELGYSYALPLSEIARISSGSHEIMLRFDLKKKVDSFNPRYF